MNTRDEFASARHAGAGVKVHGRVIGRGCCWHYLRMMRRSMIALFSAGLAVGCGSDDTTPTPEDELRGQLCDGSQDLRLAWFLSNAGGVLRTPFQIELGFSYLYVRGDCQYWVKKSGLVAHGGVLDATEEAALAELVYYEDWMGLTQLWEDPGWDDVPLMVVDDGHGEFSIGCLGECPVAPQAVRDMRAAYRDELERMWDEGERSIGPMRVLAARLPDGDPIPEPMFVVPWTVDLDLTSVAVDYLDMENVGMSALIDDPATLAELREFSDEHVDALEQFSDFYVEVEPGVIYELYLRDTVPFEAEDGLIARFWSEDP
jgi:hypothetical protein